MTYMIYHFLDYHHSEGSIILLFNNNNLLFMRIVVLLTVIFSYIAVVEGDDCLGYDNSTAFIAAQFATCSSVTTDYLP